MTTALRTMDWHGRSKVYIAKDNAMSGFYKIGCSKDPDKRCATIGSGDCSVIYSSHPDYCNGTEVHAHNLLDNRRRTWKGSGRTEWFELSEFELGIVKEMIESHSKYVSLVRKHNELCRKFTIAIEILKQMEHWIKPKFIDSFIKKLELMANDPRTTPS
jgi:hypothetical protein